MPPIFHCPALLPFNRHDWHSVAAAFAACEVVSLSQHWRKTPEADFRGACVQWGHGGHGENGDGNLWLHAVLQDDDIFNPAQKLNEHAFLLGDAFEIFLQPPGSRAYWELHLTPHNQKLQLRFEQSPLLAPDGIPTEIWDADFFWSATKIEEKQWRILVAIEAAKLEAQIEAQAHWKFSCSRYDHTRGREKPILSSSSPHKRLNFHRGHEWGSLVVE